MTSYRLLTPPDEIEEIYPYRPVWLSLALESAILFTVTTALYAAIQLIGVSLPRALIQPLNFLLALLPALLWLFFSVWRERFAPEPRRRLITVALITALAANAVAVPFIHNVVQPERWLPLASSTNRIIGYTFTVGIIQEVLKYVIVRYLAWDNEYRVRLDSVAYALASAVGYATVLNLNFVFSNTTSPEISAIQVMDNVVLNFIGSLIVAYGLAEVRFDNPNPFLLTSMIALAALINGAVTSLRAGLVNAGFSLEGSTPGLLFGIVLSAGILIAIGLIVSFLFNAAERRAREAAARED